MRTRPHSLGSGQRPGGAAGCPTLLPSHTVRKYQPSVGSSPGAGDDEVLGRVRPSVASASTIRLNCPVTATVLASQRPGQVLGRLIAAGCAGPNGAIEVCAELGEDGPDAVDRFPQPGGDSLAGPFGGAGPE